MAGSVLGLPTQVVLTQTIRNWATNPDNFIGARYMPLRDFPSHRIQYDEIASAQGMTHAHALDSDPRIVKNLAVRRHEFSPYYFKEQGVLRESDLLLTRANMTFDQLAGQRLVMNLMAQLNVRLETRIEWLRWQAMQGSVTISDNNVSLSETFGVSAMGVGTGFGGGIVTAWSNAAASIIGDLNTIASALGGVGAVLDGADLIMNRKTSNYLFKNTELQKFIVNQTGANRVPAEMSTQALFPMLVGANLVIYDQGYLDESSPPVFTRFIPDNVAILVARSIIGDELGYIATTPSLHNGGLANPQPGKFAVPDDDTGEADKNPNYSLTVGMYGGPVLLHAAFVIVMTVA